MAQLAGWLGFRVIASDDRPLADADPPQQPGHDAAGRPLDTGQGMADESGSDGAGGEVSEAAPHELVIGTVDDLLAGRVLDADTSVVLVTRNVDVDAAALPALLATDAGYIGVMGSQRRWATTRARLEAEGADPAALDRVHAPIGIEVGAETPEEIALSIMAEVVAHRRT